MQDWRQLPAALRAIITHLSTAVLLVCGLEAIGALSACSVTPISSPVAVKTAATMTAAAEATPQASATASPGESLTATPTSIPQMTDTPMPATDTPVFTTREIRSTVSRDAPVAPTATPQPSATRTRLPTHTPEAAGNAGKEAQPPTATSVPTDTPLPPVTWRLASWRQLPPCENRGSHTLFINVIDPAANGIASVPLLVEWGSGSQVIYTGQKMDRGPGWAEFPMYGGYTVRVNEGSSDVTPTLSSNLPDSQRCDSTNDNVANSFGHYSYEVVFQRTY
jgi:hypothetical protein